ncbi:uncharacterized protein LOC118801219 [Colossoma macropomum]|uniref:uncharacterized protein LOC118801219 n=1 Tax=Colossoma macropomum TaxID=42526 RepID=UPI001863A543|nr:uncharacterized protein LOC118801219 [Colossoma macropomum]
MELNLLLCLLLYGHLYITYCDIPHVSQAEGSRAILRCGNLANGTVTWSRDINEQRVDILTTHNGETTKHIADPDRHYDSRKDQALIIFRLSQSDVGRYYCSGATVKLTVSPPFISQSETEGRDVILPCINEGKVIWSQDTDGGRSDILSAENGEITQKHRPDPENRYSVVSSLSLIIKSVSLSDSGIYYCNSAPVVNLTVNPAPLKAVSSDALLTTASSLLHTEYTTTPTVAAGRVILHQNRQTDWTAGKEAAQLSPSDGEEGPSSQ